MFEKAEARQSRVSRVRRRSSCGLLLAVCSGVAGCGVGPDSTGVRLPIANGIAAHDGTVFIGGMTSAQSSSCQGVGHLPAAPLNPGPSASPATPRRLPHSA